MRGLWLRAGGLAAMGLVAVSAWGSEAGDGGWSTAGLATDRPVRGHCRRVMVGLEAAAGRSARRSVTAELDVVLEAVASGWVVRVVPHSGPTPEPDFAAIASPPYRSVNPLLLSTDFGFRAQDAVGWNPRRFRFAADWAMYRLMLPAYRANSRAGRASPAEEAALGRAVSRAPEGTVEIVDARLVSGTADQSRAAGGVASRFDQTAHRIEQPAAGERDSPLGRIRAVSVRVLLDLPGGQGGAAAAGAVSTAIPCEVR